jgi:serine/threonine protein kinase
MEKILQSINDISLASAEKSHGDDWPTRYKMIQGICQGLKSIHEKQINHLYLKPENIMLDAHMEAKITDFGLSRFLDQGQSRIITQQIRGTVRYIAPEVIVNYELSLKADMYALGIIIIELLTGISKISPVDVRTV